MYHGKEIQNELGLDTYDFEWRMYDPMIGRTFQIDPDAENYYGWSSYSWTMNNPILAIDPDGRNVVFTNEVDIRRIIEDLNRIFEAKYGESGKNAFSYKKGRLKRQCKQISLNGGILLLGKIIMKSLNMKK